MATKAEINSAVKYWDDYKRGLERSTVIDLNESDIERLARISRLESNDEEWFAYYFPNYYSSKPMLFHTRSSKRVMNNPEWYEVRAWSRELAKSARTMMEIIKLALTKKKRSVLFISNSETAAIRLLKPYKINFESNQRIINDYGVQQTLGSWTEGEFTIKAGCSFLAVGAGQTPRGARNEEVRPDVVLMDDYDTDEECRNPDTIKKKWDWFEQAVYATRSISNPMLIIFCGNIIAEHCCIKKAIEKADAYDIINIRDKNGVSSWPTKNTEEMIDRVLSKISHASAQKEYFNNPLTEGKVFKELNYKRMQPLREYKKLLAYTDPSYKKSGDTKATALLGKYKDEYHVLRMFCGKVSVSEMLEWNYEIHRWVGGRVPVEYWIEWPWIDEMFKLELAAANKRHGIIINPRPDDRKKPFKYDRIEQTLEPLNRNEKGIPPRLWFNEQEKDNPYMKTAEEQFLLISPNSRAHDDAPDAVEGGVWRINHMLINNMASVQAISTQRNGSKRF
ncbi:hypothetical protein [Nubsella zeaxanthinifaciens]|uniref:hypothetical protein n=1 Tax=Nubsella zeaxanthinifaciens TaxID=392412 RepID=UPI000DE1F3F2|nr:hypothetical protein [Nubsella zeaxanthinifaciens]